MPTNDKYPDSRANNQDYESCVFPFIFLSTFCTSFESILFYFWRKRRLYFCPMKNKRHEEKNGQKYTAPLFMVVIILCIMFLGVKNLWAKRPAFLSDPAEAERRKKMK